MPRKLDAFSAELVKVVRNMSDEAILELVRNKLGVVDTPSEPPRKAKTKTKRAAAATRASREHVLAAVESAVKSSKGLSASEIASKTKLPQSRVASALRELKQSGRIHQGGDKKFARYAGDARTAEAASNRARKR